MCTCKYDMAVYNFLLKMAFYVYVYAIGIIRYRKQVVYPTANTTIGSSDHSWVFNIAQQKKEGLVYTLMFVMLFIL